MHIDVNLMGIERDEERQHGMASAGQKVHVGSAHCTGQQFVLHRTAIDEEKLHVGLRTVQRRQTGKTR